MYNVRLVEISIMSNYKYIYSAMYSTIFNVLYKQYLIVTLKYSSIKYIVLILEL